MKMNFKMLEKKGSPKYFCLERNEDVSFFECERCIKGFEFDDVRFDCQELNLAERKGLKEKGGLLT